MNARPTASVSARTLKEANQAAAKVRRNVVETVIARTAVNAGIPVNVTARRGVEPARDVAITVSVLGRPRELGALAETPVNVLLLNPAVPARNPAATRTANAQRKNAERDVLAGMPASVNAKRVQNKAAVSKMIRTGITI